MAYGWIIDEDHVTEPGDGLPSRVGWTGPRGIPKRLAERLKAGEGEKFRVLMDDEMPGDTLAYVGRYVADESDENATGFEPLDDFGQPDVGCTTIEYLDASGEWEVL